MHSVGRNRKPTWSATALVGISTGLILGAVPGLAGADDRAPRPVEVGVRYATGVTTLEASDDDRAVGVEARHGSSSSLGAYVTWWRLGWLQLQTELLHSTREVMLVDTTDDMRAGYSLKYLELPALVRLDIPRRSRMTPFLAFGAAPALLIDARHSAGIDPSDILHRLDLGLVGAVGARVALFSGLHVTVEARGVYGVADVFTRTPRRNRGMFLSMALAYDRAPRHAGRIEHREAEQRVAEDSVAEDGEVEDSEVEVVERGVVGLRFRLARARSRRAEDPAIPILVGGKPRVTRLTRGPHIGYIYRVEGYLNGQRVVYIGSAASIKTRLVKGHEWHRLLTQESTTVYVKKVYGTPDIAASGRGTPLSATREALRSMEEPELKKAEKRAEKENRKRKPGQKRTRVLNVDRAAREPHVWQKRHQTSRQIRWRRIKRPGSGIRLGAVSGGLLLLDVYRMYRDDKMSRYVMAPYVLEDEHGAFTLFYDRGILGGLFSSSYYKRYIAGQYKGRKIQVSDSEFEALRDEAEALWGTVDWWGDFVPGLLQPELPRMNRHGDGSPDRRTVMLEPVEVYGLRDGD